MVVRCLGMFHETVTVVESRGDVHVPEGYVIRYHESRGYDSPDRWYTACTKRHRYIGEFGTFGKAVEACEADRAARKAKGR